MTARDRLADAYEEQAAIFARLAEVTAQVAHELRGIEPSAARADVPDSVPAAPAVAAAGAFPPPAAVTICPKHRVEFTEGQYGPYCKQVTDDPAWGKVKGDRMWCRITPKNAAEWLRVNAA